MRAGHVIQCAHHVVESVAQDRDIRHRVVVGRSRVQTQEAPLPNHVAFGIELLYTDVVHVSSAVHSRSGVRLAQDKQVRFAGLGSHGGGQYREGQRDGVVVFLALRALPQDAQPASGNRTQRVFTFDGDQVVLAVTQERQVVVREPLQQCAGLVDLVGIHPYWRVLVQLVRDAVGLIAHRMPIGHGLANIAEHAPSGVDQRFEIVGDEIAFHFNPHPRFDKRGGRCLVHIDVEHFDEGSVRIAPDRELRVDDEMHVASGVHQIRGNRIDEEGHIVGHDLDDRITDTGDIGSPSTDQRFTGLPVARPLPHRLEFVHHLRHLVPGELLIRKVAVEAGRECALTLVRKLR